MSTASRLVFGFKFAVIVVLSAFVLGGCTGFRAVSDPVDYYLLDQYQAVSPDMPWEAGARAVHVKRPHLPDYLNSGRIFYRAGDGSPAYTQRERWGEPIDEGLARVLAQRLSERAGFRVFSSYPAPPVTRNAYELNLHVMQFELAGDGQVVLDVIWRMDRPGQKEGDARRLRLDRAVPADASIAEIVRTMGSLLDRLAGEIAAESGGGS